MAKLMCCHQIKVKSCRDVNKKTDRMKTMSMFCVFLDLDLDDFM